ncbi:MAG: NAD(P)H-dependent oxidoreductase [Candidatus Woesearchaeota archaeon]
MKTLVVYYSRTGNTRTIAESISESLSCDIEELTDNKKRTGPLGYLICGKEGSMKSTPKINDLNKDISEYKLIIIGTPIWSFNMSGPIRSFVTKFKDSIGKVAFFCTEGGRGGEIAFKEMSEILWKQPLATLEITSHDIRDKTVVDKMNIFISKILNSKK